MLCSPMSGLHRSPSWDFTAAQLLCVRTGARRSRRRGVHEHHLATASGRFGLTRAAARVFVPFAAES